MTVVSIDEARHRPDPSRAFLADLRRDIEAHPGVNHLFLARCATSPFARQDYRVFGENHYALVCVFTSYLERLLVRAPSSDAKLWLAKVLVDEYGEGSEGHDHATLYGDFLAACGSDLHRTPDAKVPEPAYRFIREHRRIVTEEPFLVGLGAVGPGHEWAIPKMFHAVIPGLRRAIVLLLADSISRTIVAPAELPIGIVTAAVGAPFFLWILLRKRGVLDL